MGRPKNNEKVIKYAEGSLSDVENKIDNAVLIQDFKTAVILKEWKLCMLTIIRMLEDKEGTNGGKRNPVVEKLPESNTP